MEVILYKNNREPPSWGRDPRSNESLFLPETLSDTHWPCSAALATLTCIRNWHAPGPHSLLSVLGGTFDISAFLFSPSQVRRRRFARVYTSRYQKICNEQGAGGCCQRPSILQDNSSITRHLIKKKERKKAMLRYCKWDDSQVTRSSPVDSSSKNKV